MSYLPTKLLTKAFAGSKLKLRATVHMQQIGLRAQVLAH